MALGARLRMRRAHALQVCAFALLKETYLKSEHAKKRLRELSARWLKYSAALCAYKLQVDNELEARTRTAAARHFRGWMMRACIRGWCAFVAELYRGLEAASMSARYRAMEACNIWLYSLDFNRRLRALPVAATNPLGVNGWLARVPIAKMPAVLLEDQVMRILQHALAGWQEVLEDEQKTQGMRGKWREHRIRQGLPSLPLFTPLHTSPFIPITSSLLLLSTPLPSSLSLPQYTRTHMHATCSAQTVGADQKENVTALRSWMHSHNEYREAIARLEIIGAKLLLSKRLSEWNTMAQTAAHVFRRKYHLM